MTREREYCIDNEEGVLCWQWRGSIVLTRERKYCVSNGEGVLYRQGRGGSVLASKRSTVLAKGKSTVLAGERQYLAGKGVLDLQGIESNVLAREY